VNEKAADFAFSAHELAAYKKNSALRVLFPFKQANISAFGFWPPVRSCCWFSCPNPNGISVLRALSQCPFVGGFYLAPP
jgi:hypothetical protein